MSEERKSVAVDFDGVLHQWDGEWRGHHVIQGQPIPGAIEWLHTVLQTYDVFIFTTRAATFRGRYAIRLWLREHALDGWDDTWHDGPILGLRRVLVTNRKRRALIYVDDRSFRFDGINYPSINRIRSLRPWWKGGTVVREER